MSVLTFSIKIDSKSDFSAPMYVGDSGDYSTMAKVCKEAAQYLLVRDTTIEDIVKILQNHFMLIAESEGSAKAKSHVIDLNGYEVTITLISH